jgi:hypothetical protein
VSSAYDVRSDHGPRFTGGFDAVFHAAEIRIVTTGIRAPVMNAIRERWHRSVRTEPLDRALVWDLAHQRRVLAEYESFYNRKNTIRISGGASRCRLVGVTTASSCEINALPSRVAVSRGVPSRPAMPRR